jgi:hypothetical protein
MDKAHGTQQFDVAALLDGPRPSFHDNSLGETEIRTQQGTFTLRLKMGGYSVSSEEGDELLFDYSGTKVSYQVVSVRGRVNIDWNYEDPDHFEFSIAANGRASSRRTSFDKVVPAFQSMIDDMGPNHGSSFAPFHAWMRISEDFNFEFRRRVRAALPSEYFDAMRRVPIKNRMPMAGCVSTCVMCALALETGPFDFWCGICLACGASGGDA